MPQTVRWKWAWEHRVHFTRQGPAVVRTVLAGVLGGSVVAIASVWYQHQSRITATSIGVIAAIGAAAILTGIETLVWWLKAPRILAEQRVQELTSRVGILEADRDRYQQSLSATTEQLEESKNLLDRSLAIQRLADALILRYQEGIQLIESAPQTQNDIQDWKRRENEWHDNVEATLRRHGGNALDIRYFRVVRSYRHIQDVKAHPDAIGDVYQHMERMSRVNQPCREIWSLLTPECKEWQHEKVRRKSRCRGTRR